jgi:MFS family permease
LIAPISKTMPRELACIAVLYLVGLGAAAQLTKLVVTFPEVTSVYVDSGPASGLILSVLALCGAVFGLVAGRLVAFILPRTLLLHALAVSSALSLLQATTPQLPVMLVLRALEGVAHLVIVVAAPTLLASSTSPRLRPLAMALWSTIVAAAFAITALLADGVRLPGVLFGHGVLMAALLPLAATILRDGSPHVETPRLCSRGFVGLHVEAYRKASVRIPAMAFFAYASCYVSGLTLVASYTEQPSLAGILPAFGIAVSLTIAITVLKRVSAWTILKVGLALAAVSAVVLSWASSAVAPWLLLYGALPTIQAATFAAVPQLSSSDADRSLAYGAIAQAGNLGNLIGPPLILAATEHSGPAGGALYIAAMLFAAFIVLVTVGRVRAPE